MTPPHFDAGIWVLIAPVPGHCILVTFIDLYGRVDKGAGYGDKWREAGVEGAGSGGRGDGNRG